MELIEKKDNSFPWPEALFNYHCLCPPTCSLLISLSHRQPIECSMCVPSNVDETKLYSSCSSVALVWACWDLKWVFHGCVMRSPLCWTENQTLQMTHAIPHAMREHMCCNNRCERPNLSLTHYVVECVNDIVVIFWQLLLRWICDFMLPQNESLETNVSMSNVPPHWSDHKSKSHFCKKNIPGV